MSTAWSQKRRASRSPESVRPNKRSAPSSPEEGELDDPTAASSSLPPLPPSVPQKPKIKFPFKKKKTEPAEEEERRRSKHRHYRRSRSRSNSGSPPQRHHRLPPRSPESPRRDHRSGKRDRWKASEWWPDEDDRRDRYRDRDREWTRRDDSYDRRRHRRDYSYENDYRRSPYRPISPPRYRPVSPRTPPRPQAAPPKPPPTPPEKGIPPQPATSPPPPPPPDTRLQQPLKRPGAPKEDRSPPTFSAARDEQPPKELPKLRLPKLNPVQRTRDQEKEAYGRIFKGCGAQSDYEITTKLGEGTFGEVHKAVQKYTNRPVALKRILMHNEKEGMPVTALREIKILKALNHPCIVNILDMFIVKSTDKDPLSVYMVFPYMDHDLAGLLENERVKLQPSHIKLYMKQLLEGTEYMHRNHILHRDMKAANLLISNNGTLQIADFGLARSFDKDATKGSSDHRGKDRRYTNCVVTRWYRPPELLLGARLYGGEVDLWGIGCVFGEMFLRRPILPGTSDLDQLDKIWQLCGSPNQHTWPNYDSLPGCEGVKPFHTNYSRRINKVFHSVGPDTVDLLERLLTCNPRDRITASQALDHEYFWTDPLPADPKTLPSYEASHEYDKRSQRLQQQPPPGPPPQPPHHSAIQPPPIYMGRPAPPTSQAYGHPGAPPPHGHFNPHHRPPAPQNPRNARGGDRDRWESGRSNSHNNYRPNHLPPRPPVGQGAHPYMGHGNRPGPGGRGGDPGDVPLSYG